MECFDFCNSVISTLQSSEPEDDEFCKLLMLISLYDFVWLNKKTNIKIIDIMLDRLISSKKHCLKNMEQVTEIIEKYFSDDPEIIGFVRASRILFHTYNNTGRLFQLKNKLIFKNKRFMQQFKNIKENIIVCCK